jgi:hypothetical protein
MMVRANATASESLLTSALQIGASLLSTYLWLFPLVSAWLLFFCGFFNVVSGMIFRAPGRDMRSILASRRKRVAAPKPRTTPPAMSSLANLGASAVDKLRRKRVTPRKAPAAAPPMTTRELKSFPSLETVSHAELLRQRAREANLRAEREEEARERRVRELRELMALDDAQEAAADKDLERGLSDVSEWNEAHGLPFPRTAEMARQQQAELAQRQQPSTSASKPAAPTQGAAADAGTVARAQAGANADLEPWRRSTHSASSKKRRAAAGGLSGAREIAARGTAAVRRRNLVLSRHLRELRLGAAPKARKNAAPPLPKAPHMRVAPSPGAASAFSAQSHYASADEANPDDDDDDDDQLIFVGAPPLPAYVPGGTRIVRADIEHTRDDAPVLPVAKQWASEWASAPALPSERAQHSVTRKAVPRRHIPSSGPPI